MGPIFTLECVLAEYRIYSSSDYYRVDNENALHHLIVQVKNWKVDDIRGLSINDRLFNISDRLKPDYMLAEAAQFLRTLKLSVTHYSVDVFSEADWDPRKNSVFL
ncbi:hypothetical protein [Salmonella enterica]|uniref:ECs1072 family phage-associated protein n=1 Tax=Salmonella enterica TaxID=28901 RepID=UPI00398C727A